MPENYDLELDDVIGLINAQRYFLYALMVDRGGSCNPHEVYELLANTNRALANKLRLPGKRLLTMGEIGTHVEELYALERLYRLAPNELRCPTGDAGWEVEDEDAA